MRRAIAASLLIGLLWAGPGADGALAHSGLISSDPAPGTELGTSPAAVRISFSEETEPSLSEIEVLDAEGNPVQSGAPEAVPNDVLALAVPVPALPRGSYTVAFRAISAVDGHATAGAFAFGVGVPAAGVAAEPPGGDDGISPLELVARWVLLIGVGLLLGASVAGLGRFGGSSGSDLVLACAGWFAAVVGLVLLTVVQRRTAGSSLADLADTPVGEALLGRAIALAVAGAGVVALLGGWRSPRVRLAALAAMALGALGAIAVHVDAGHAAASGWSTTVTVTAQVAHFAAAGIWFGGLAALLLGVRGAESAEKDAAVRRYAVVALGALIVVVATGTLRAVDELSAPDDLFSTGYGRAVLAKIVLIALIAALALRNRRHNVPRAPRDLEPLRRASRAELGLAVAAVAAAAVLGSLAPPVDQPQAASPGLSASGSDAAETLEVELEAASDQPGANTFTARIEQGDAGEAVEADRVTLRFDPLDDPGAEQTALVLEPAADGSYTGTGGNLSFEGRWVVTAAVERGGETVEAPIRLDVPIPERRVSPLRAPGQPSRYDLQVEDDGFIRILVDPEGAGANRVRVEFFDDLQNRAPARSAVLTTTAGDDPVREVPLRRLAPNAFEGVVELEAGANAIAVVGSFAEGIHLSGTLELEVPGTESDA